MTAIGTVLCSCSLREPCRWIQWTLLFSPQVCTCWPLEWLKRHNWKRQHSCQTVEFVSDGKQGRVTSDSAAWMPTRRHDVPMPTIGARLFVWLSIERLREDDDFVLSRGAPRNRFACQNDRDISRSESHRLTPALRKGRLVAAHSFLLSNACRILTEIDIGMQRALFVRCRVDHSAAVGEWPEANVGLLDPRNH